LRYFVTGATGFIGGCIARQLVEAGHEVVALARDPARAARLRALGNAVTVHTGDITDRESMRAPMTGVDGIYHVAAWYKIGTRDKDLALGINAQGTANVLTLMRELGVPKGVYTSTLAVFGDTGGRIVDESYRMDGPWLSEYDRTKWMAHYQVALPLMREGLPLVIAQPGLVYGPGDEGVTHNLFVQYLRGQLPATPERTAFCWGHVEDTARGHLLAMEHGRAGESYIIAGPVHTLIEGMALAAEITCLPAPRLHPPPGMLRATAAVMDLVGRAIPLPESYTGESLRVTAGSTYTGSSAKARRELGFTARPLAEGLRETLAWEMRQLGMAGQAIGDRP
jgi:nucleoside-diphosphate-sugar epimerase